MRLIKIAVLTVLLGCRLSLFAQYFSTGEDPAGIKWREIRTANFQLIFPEDYEQKAVEVAHLFEMVYQLGYQTLDHPPKKISVILHTHTVKSNGLVAWSPKRVELFPTPHQKIYAQDWLEQLAVHEFRHVVQMDKIQDELPALLPVLFGEQAAAAAVGAYLPFWFLEGDAVITETALTRAGRGRLPYFLMENKAQAVEKGLFPYDKAALGSYKDFVPNRYKFGYWLAGGIREKYGATLWSDVLSEIGSRPVSVNPLNRVLKKRTGHGKEVLYKTLFQDYLSEWKAEQDSLKRTPTVRVSPENKLFANYRYISALTDSSFVAYKESREDIGRIVLVTNGKETVLHTPGTIFEESFSRTGNLLIWSERRLDLRWTHADRSVIVLFNLYTKDIKEFSMKEKIFSPVVSPNFESFAAVTVNHSNRYELGIYNLESGHLMRTFSIPGNHYIFTPSWDDFGEMLYFIVLSDEGKCLSSLNTNSGEFTELTPAHFYDIRNPEFHDNKLYFTSSKTGIDNIFCLDLKTRQVSQLSSVPFGADYPTVVGVNLFFSNYNSNGYHVARLNLDESLQKSDSEIVPYTYKLAEALAAQEDTVLDFTAEQPVNYETRPYRKLAHLFNFHSWAPAYINVNDYEVRPGVSLMSQNKLGTANTHVGYEYDLAEDAGKYKIDFEYSGLFPVIKAGVGYGKRKSAYYEVSNTVDRQGNILQSDTTIRNFSWNELEFELSSRVPFYFNKGKYTQILQPEVKYNYRKVTHNQTTPDQFYQGYYHSMSYRLYFQNIIRQAELDIQPDWGQIIELSYRNSPGGGTKIGDLMAFQSYLYIPGLVRNHGIRFYNGYQQKSNNKDLAFSDIVRYPRGFNRFQHDELYSFGADYVMPICYPDKSLGRLFFLKRIRSSAFYDFAHLKGTIYDENGLASGKFTGSLKSAGLELTGDGHFLRLTAPVSIGIRGIYMPDIREFRTELMLSVNFDSL